MFIFAVSSLTNLKMNETTKKVFDVNSIHPQKWLCKEFIKDVVFPTASDKVITDDMNRIIKKHRGIAENKTIYFRKLSPNEWKELFRIYDANYVR